MYGSWKKILFQYSIKRFIGRKAEEVSEELKQVSYNVIGSTNGSVKIECPALNKDFAPEEISAQGWINRK